MVYAGYTDGPAVLGSGIYFASSNFTTNVTGLYRSDGTAAGTTLVTQLGQATTGGIAQDFSIVGGSTLLFETDTSPKASAGGGNGALWRSDGTAAGTYVLAGVSGPVSNYPGQLVVTGSLAFFVGTGGSLWQTDGTTAGTHLVAPATAGPTGGLANQLGRPGGLVDAGNGRLLFAADDGLTGVEVWSTDGTAADTAEVRDVNATTADSSPHDFATIGSRVLFDANGSLDVSDGTAAGTSPLHAFASVYTGESATFFLPVGPVTYFIAADAAGRGLGVWRTDGTAPGTVELNTNGILPTAATGLAYLGGRVYFINQSSPGNGSQPVQTLYATDGTAAGTVAVAPADDLSYGSTQIPTLVAAAGKVFFLAAPPGSGSFLTQLYQTDGTAAGTSEVSTPGSVYSLAAIGGLAYYGVGGAQSSPLIGPYRTDGTAAGTVQLTTAQPDNATYGSGLTDVAGRAYFYASDAAHGDELWSSDGTAAGTAMVADINPGTASSDTGLPMAALGNKLVFYARSGTGDAQPFVSDGTAAGTRQLATVTGLTGSTTAGVATGGGRAYFVQTSATGLGSLTVSDGTPAGTVVAARLSAAPIVSPESGVAVTAAGIAVFAASDPAHGSEPWVYVPGGPAGLPGTTGNDTYALAADGAYVDVWVDTPTPAGTGTPTEELLASDAPSLALAAGAGTDALTVAGAVAVPVTPTGFESVAVTAGGSLTLAGDPSAVRGVVSVGSLSIATGGRVDVGTADLIVTGTPLATVSGWTATAFAGGTWTGPGLTSSAAAADGHHLTAVGVVTAGPVASFDGVPVAPSAVLVRATYYGDSDLSGQVNAADYARIDNGFVNQLTGWANGDLNYDGVVDGSDYALADNAFDQQAAAAPAALVAPAAIVTAVPASAVVERAGGRIATAATPSARPVYVPPPWFDPDPRHRRAATAWVDEPR